MNVIEELAAGLPGLATLRILMDAGGQTGLGATLDQTLVEVDDGRVCFTGDPGPAAFNPMGTVHGGYIATLLDSACGCAVHSKLSARQIYTTLELKVSYLRAVIGGSGPLRAEGRAVSVGRKAAFADAELRDAKGRLCATASSTLIILERPVERGSAEEKRE
jgi:uncharacterized protein (TIGR00369 family)